MMRRLVLSLAFAALATGGTAEPPNWTARIGPTHNSYPGGSSDDFNFFGALEGCIDDYPDTWDVVDPGYEHQHSVALIFRGDQYGDNLTYPEDGLAWDMRQPYSEGYKVWKIELVSTDEGYTYDLYYDFDPFGHPLPPDWICRLDMDGEINGDNYLDLSLYEFDLNHKEDIVLEDLPQSGGSEIWYVIAGIPEPVFGQLMGLVLAVAAIGLTRMKG